MKEPRIQWLCCWEIDVSVRSFFSMWDVLGKDVATFLQAQTSNDVPSLDDHTAQLSCYSNAKGRMWWNGLLWKMSPQHYRILLPSSGSQKAMQRLSMFVLRNRVSIELCCQDISVYRFDSPAKPHTHHASRVHLFEDLWATTPQGNKNEEHPTPESYDSWMLSSIRHGYAWITEPTQEQWVTQMIHWDRLGGVSFTKGCYPGQEVIARMHYLGKAKRGLCHVRSRIHLASGMELFSPSVAQQSVGQIINAAVDSDRYYHALAVLSLNLQEQRAPLFLDKACEHDEVSWMDTL